MEFLYAPIPRKGPGIITTMIYGVSTNSLEISLILQPTRSDVKIDPGRVHGNRL